LVCTSQRLARTKLDLHGSGFRALLHSSICIAGAMLEGLDSDYCDKDEENML
jgi:hypothetical protein